MYTLASASVLAIQVAQHPCGARLADTLDRVLALTPAELAALTASPEGPGAHLDALEPEHRTGLLAVHELLRRERPLVQAPEPAAQAALEAVTAAWTDAPVPARWRQVLGPHPVDLPDTPYAEDLRRLLEEVLRRSPDQLRRVVDAHARRRGQLAWSTRMHEACLAASEADRLRDTARAQLAAARALHLSGAPALPDFHALGMALTGAVQALCTGDLLDTTQLQEAWLAGS